MNKKSVLAIECKVRHSWVAKNGEAWVWLEIWVEGRFCGHDLYKEGDIDKVMKEASDE